MSRMLVEQIIVGNRRRKDMGDITSLAASIKARGLLHPIVVDSSNRLVAGERRLRAVRSLGQTWIEVKQLDELTDAERNAIELEENTRRKDLTAAERSEETVAKAEAMREVLPKSGKTDSGGRPPIDRVAKATVAAAIGVPRQTLELAESHVAAIERYPELRDAPQSYALATAKALDALPVDERERERERMRAETGLRSRKRRSPNPRAYDRPEISHAGPATSVIEGTVSRHVVALMQLCKIAPNDVADALSDECRASLANAIHVARLWFEAYESAARSQ